ncbi:hypothetical protein EVG20_g6951 [Dentipellis fragilis]|uniref:C2H2-type domain-containing protein n=1 Tax=Dentipellis fragilis TaxID=205917 RepID=A0A4Y9YGP6_9AGAM|nr:hypothetical protein EVG20_g6951 [Dentipellis fragilis]
MSLAIDPFSRGLETSELVDLFPVSGDRLSSTIYAFEVPRSRRGSADENFKAAMRELGFPLEEPYDFTFTCPLPLEKRDLPLEKGISSQSFSEVPAHTELYEEDRGGVAPLESEIVGNEQDNVPSVAGPNAWTAVRSTEDPTDEVQVLWLEEGVMALPTQALVEVGVFAPAPSGSEMNESYLAENENENEKENEVEVEVENEKEDGDEDEDEDEESVVLAIGSASTRTSRKRARSESLDGESDSDASDDSEVSATTSTGTTSTRPAKKRKAPLFAFERQCQQRSRTLTHPDFNDLVCRVILDDGRVCETVSSTVKKCFAHRDSHFGRSFVCAVCQKSFGYMYTLKRHVKETPFCKKRASKFSYEQWEVSMNNMRWMKPGWLRPRTDRAPAQFLP